MTFVLDASASTTEANFVDALKPAMKGIIESMFAVSNEIRVACVVFSTSSVLQWSFNENATSDDLFKAVNELKYYKGETASGDALHDVLTQIHPNVQPGVKHVVILATDGEENSGDYEVLVEAEKLKAAGAQLFVLGVGEHVKTNVLQRMSSGFHFFEKDVTNYAHLIEQMKKIAAVPCE
jgi:Mg-chelatase subunit ChlD